MSDIILETKGLTKHYGGVHALEDADFALKTGEHVAIMGDNGAGKSTFVRQITGVEQRTRGTVIFDGEEVNFAGPLDAREAGIETVFQTLALADDLNVPDNLFLGREKTMWNFLGPFSRLDYRAMRDDTMAGLVKTGVKIPNIKNTIANMSGGQRKCVAIARTATFASKLTIMDEPTAALGVACSRGCAARIAVAGPAGRTGVRAGPRRGGPDGQPHLRGPGQGGSARQGARREAARAHPLREHRGAADEASLAGPR